MQRQDLRKGKDASFWRNNSVYFVLFALLFLLFRAIPPMVDRLVSPVHYGEGGLLHWISRQGYHYTHYNGRVISTFFSGIVEAYTSDIPWDVLCDLVCVGTGFAMCAALAVEGAGRRALAVVWTVALVLGMPTRMRAEVIYYAFFVYVTPLLFLLVFLWALRRYLSPAPGSKKLVYGLLFSMALVLGNWIEHVSLGFCVALGLATLWVVAKTRKPHAPLWIACGLAGIGLLALFLSPGLALNRGELGGSAASMAEHFTENIRYISEELLGGATLFFTLLYLLSFLFSLVSGTPHRKWRAASLAVNGLCFLFLLGCSLSLIPALGEGLFSFFQHSFVFQPNRTWIGVFVPVCGVFLFALALSLWFSSRRLELYFVLATAFFGLGAISLTAQLSPRVVSFGYLAPVCVVVYFTLALLPRQGRPAKAGTALVLALCLLVADQLFVQARRIGRVQAQREALLADAAQQQQLRAWNYDEDILVLPYFQEDDLFLQEKIFPDGSYFPDFLRFYGLSEHTRAVYSNTTASFRWDWDGEDFTIEVRPDAPAEGLMYRYDVWTRETTDFIESPRFTYTPPENGYYIFSVTLRYADGTELRIQQPCEMALFPGTPEVGVL